LSVQVAEQVRAGLVLVPLKLALRPKEVLPPEVIAALSAVSHEEPGGCHLEPA
jgi:hypothetical protein